MSGSSASERANGEPTVFVVEDDGRVRSSLAALVEASGFPVEAYETGVEFLEAYDGRRPGCLILDLRLPPPLDGFDVQDELRRRGSTLPVIVLTGHGDVTASVRALKGGALEFFEKPARPRELIAAIEKAIDADRQARERTAGTATLERALHGLTRRQREVLEHVLRGRSSKEAATALGISVRTVEGHRRWILQRIGVSSLAELMAKFIAREPRD